MNLLVRLIARASYLTITDLVKKWFISLIIRTERFLMVVCLLAGNVLISCLIFLIIFITAFSLFITGKQKLSLSCSKPWTSREISMKEKLINHLFTKVKTEGDKFSSKWKRVEQELGVIFIGVTFSSLVSLGFYLEQKLDFQIQFIFLFFFLYLWV